MFRADGYVRTTNGWIDHRSKPKDRVAVSGSFSQSGPTDILNAIKATSARHGQNRALSRVGLTRNDWHALFRALIEAESGYRPSAMSLSLIHI